MKEFDLYFFTHGVKTVGVINSIFNNSPISVSTPALGGRNLNMNNIFDYTVGENIIATIKIRNYYGANK